MANDRAQALAFLHPCVSSTATEADALAFSINVDPCSHVIGRDEPLPGRHLNPGLDLRATTLGSVLTPPDDTEQLTPPLEPYGVDVLRGR